MVLIWRLFESVRVPSMRLIFIFDQMPPSNGTIILITEAIRKVTEYKQNLSYNTSFIFITGAFNALSANTLVRLKGITVQLSVQLVTWRNRSYTDYEAEIKFGELFLRFNKAVNLSTNIQLKLSNEALYCNSSSTQIFIRISMDKAECTYICIYSIVWGFTEPQILLFKN